MLRALCLVSVFSSTVFMSGQAPLLDAARKGDVETVRLLLGGRANTEVRDRNAWTPPHHAASRGTSKRFDCCLTGEPILKPRTTEA